MNRILLDTCTFVWLSAQPEQLGVAAKREMGAGQTELYLSDASVWEICLKWKSGKLQLPAPPRRWVEEQAAIWQLVRVALTADDMFRTTELPDLHRDPFDRLLVAQAISRGMTIATPDQSLRAYPVASVW